MVCGFADRDGAKRLSVDEYPLQIVLKARELSCDCCRLILEETNTKKVLVCRVASYGAVILLVTIV